MDRDTTDIAPTSSAATAETEPEVVAGISSAEGRPDIATDIRVGTGGFSLGLGTSLLLLAGGLALGYGAAYWMRRRG